MFFFFYVFVILGRDFVTTTDILLFVSPSFPEISLAISQYAAGVYVGGGVDGSGIWSAASFTDLQHDMYSANPLLYAEAMRDIWGLKVD
ncbi:hypothetical protein EON65_46400 [archaeon]|nr:MAG: hypothetical protein EON65_46400 [archaeon]